MAEEKNDKIYPIKSLHDFLFELDKEWSKFRNGSLITLISSSLMLLIVLWLIIVIRRVRGAAPVEFIFLFAVIVFLGYSIYSMYKQYRFFNKWERRIGLLLHLEEEMLQGKLEEKKT
jgi:hypothetical protein